MAKSNDLTQYKRKRNFSKTPEPKGTNTGSSAPKPIFVIQKHDASHLHYDFRLEVNGVLKSWAIPKGLPESTHDKRLAIETEDHPLEYANFEGDIPKEEYGGGKVEIWDKGTFNNITSKGKNKVTAADAIKNGHITISLEGEKLSGEFTLLLFKTKKDKKEWLIIKKL